MFVQKINRNKTIISCILLTCLLMPRHVQPSMYNWPIVGRMTHAITRVCSLKPVFSFIGRHKVAAALLTTSAILGTCYWQRNFLRDCTGKGLRNIALKLDTPSLLKLSYKIMTSDTANIFKAQDSLTTSTPKPSPSPTPPTYQDTQENFNLLQQAIRNGNFATIEQCAKDGCNFNEIFNKHNAAPDLDLTLPNDQILSVIDCLIKNGYALKNESSLLHQLVTNVISKNDQQEKTTLWNLASSIIKRGADINAPFENGKTCLHICAEKGTVYDVSACIVAQANTTVTDNLGNNVFHSVMLNQNKEAMYDIIEYLIGQENIQKHLNNLLTQQNKSGETPLFLACKDINLSAKPGIDPFTFICQVCPNNDINTVIKEINTNSENIVHAFAYNKDYGATLFDAFKQNISFASLNSLCTQMNNNQPPMTPVVLAASLHNWQLVECFLRFNLHLAQTDQYTDPLLFSVVSDKDLTYEQKIELINLLVDTCQQDINRKWPLQNGKTVFDILEPGSQLQAFLNEKQQKINALKQQQENQRLALVEAIKSGDIGAAGQPIQNSDILDGIERPMHLIDIETLDSEKVIAMATWLKDQKINIDQEDERHLTLLQKTLSCLMQASEQSKIEKYKNIALGLIKLGANVNQLEPPMKKPFLLYAITQNNLDLVNFLLNDCKVNPNITCECETTPLDYCFTQLNSNKPNLPIITVLKSHGAELSQNNQQRVQSYLENAIATCNVDNAQAFLAMGAQLIKIRNPIHLIDIFTQQVNQICNMIDFLAQNKVNVDQFDRMGRSLLHRIFDYERHDQAQWSAAQEQIARCLIKNDANINVQDQFGNTPLHLAIMKVCTSGIITAEIKLLLTLNADVNIANKEKETPLDMLLSCESAIDTTPVEILQLLKEAGAKLTITKKPKGAMFTVLARAIQTCNAPMIKILLELSAELNNKPIQEEGYYGKVPMDLIDINLNLDNQKVLETIKTLQQHRVPIDQCDQEGNTLCAKILRDFTENNSRTPEQIAELVCELVKLGANPNCPNYDRKTLLHSLFENQNSTEFGRMCYVENKRKSMTTFIDCLFSVGANLCIEPQVLNSASQFAHTNAGCSEICSTIIPYLKEKRALQEKIITLRLMNHSRCGSKALRIPQPALESIERQLINEAKLEHATQKPAH